MQGNTLTLGGFRSGRAGLIMGLAWNGPLARTETPTIEGRTLDARADRHNSLGQRSRKG